VGAAPSRDIPHLLAYAARGEPSRAPLISAELPLAGVQQALDSLAAAVGGGT
jgi:Zn-dependent alcohol dehydrogenase